MPTPLLTQHSELSAFVAQSPGVTMTQKSHSSNVISYEERSTASIHSDDEPECVTASPSRRQAANGEGTGTHCGIIRDRDRDRPL